MTAVSLSLIVDEALAKVGVLPPNRSGLGPTRTTQWAKELPGFGLRTYGSGRRVYVVQTMMEGRLRTVTLCSAALVSRRKAMEVARHVLLRAQTNQNPADERIRRRSTPAFDRFLALYWERCSPRWKASTRLTQDQYRRRYLDGAFGRKGIDKITQGDVAEWIAAVSQRAGEGGANRLLEILRAAFNRAEEWGIIPAGTNPTNGIKRYPRRRVARFLREEELARIGEALQREAPAYPQQVAAILLLLLTGCRSSEITGLLWSEVVGNRLKLTDSKTGPRTVWLGAEARNLLDQIAADARAEVFWNKRLDRPLKISSYWSDFRVRHGFDRLRIHDLRHSFASLAAAKSETLPMIGQLLGHRGVQSTARYAHLDDADLIETAQQVGDRIDRLLRG